MKWPAWVALGAAFFVAGCLPNSGENQPKQGGLFDGQRRSTNIEDYRNIKPKTAFLLNGLGVYGKPGMFGPIKAALEKKGYVVTVLNHTDGKRLTHMPDVLIGHSMGANAALKRSQAFKTYPPKLIVSIDAGRAPLFHQAHPKARTVDISCPWHPIGGQRIEGSDVYREVCGTAHIAMPHDKRVIDIIIKEVEALK